MHAGISQNGAGVFQAFTQAKTDASHPIGAEPSRRCATDMEAQARLPGILRLADLFTVATSGLVPDLLIRGGGVRISAAWWEEVLLGTLLAANYFHFGGAYARTSVIRESLKHPAIGTARIISAWSCAIITLVGLLQFAADRQSFWEIWEINWAVTCAAMLIAVRIFLHTHLARLYSDGRLRTNVAIVGQGFSAARLIERLRLQSDDLNIVGTFCDEKGEPGKTGTIYDLISLMQTMHVDEIIVAAPWTSTTAVSSVLSRLSQFAVDVKLDLCSSGLNFVPDQVGATDQNSMLSLQHRPLTGWNIVLKRAEDVILSIALLILLAVPGLIVMLLIKLDSNGPIFFCQERFGFHNHRFMVFKFRTMQYDPRPKSVIIQARRNDPRITRIGAWLRRTSIDEFPQLINVLRGDMSLVGPRPHASSHNLEFSALIDGYLSRHRVKPGITGWAQINGLRGETETIEKMQLRLQHDLFYIDRWSLFFDLKIVLLTIPAMISGRNAW